MGPSALVRSVKGFATHGGLPLTRTAITASPIYTSEPMVTRALAAEIRHEPARFLQTLARHAGGDPYGALRSVRCEAAERIDVLLELDRSDGEPFRIGIEAKFDHELTRGQIDRERAVVDKLFVLVSSDDAVPRWLLDDYDDVSVMTWAEALACFTDSRLTAQDVSAIKLSKVRVEAILRGVDMESRLPGWSMNHQRNGNGNPSIAIYSPTLPDGRIFRGQIQVAGFGTPDTLEDLRFEGFFGIEVTLDDTNYFDPDESNAIPPWIESLRTLLDEVIVGHEGRLLISRHAAGAPRRSLGRFKLPLAKAHLGTAAYLAKGYVDWSLGPKTKNVTVEQLPELADITAEIYERWFDAEKSRQLGARTSTSSSSVRMEP